MRLGSGSLRIAPGVLGGLVVLALLGVPRISAAQPGPIRFAVALDYRANSGCSSAEGFLRALSQRNEGVVLASPGEAAALVRVWLSSSPAEETASGTFPDGAGGGNPREVAGHPPQILGRLELDFGGEHTTREVVGESCEEVSAALALSLAILVETLAPGSTPAEPAKPGLPSLAAPTPAVPPAPRLSPVTMDSVLGEPPTPPRPRGPSWSVRMGGGLGFHTTIAPEITPVGSVHLELVHPMGGPLLRLSASYGGSTSSQTSAGSARFLFGAGELLGCPWVGSKFGLTWAPCGVIEVGALQGRAVSAVNRTTSTGGWIAPGGAVLLQKKVRWITVGATAGFTLPLIRDRFFFLPNVLVHRPAAVDLRGELTVSFVLR